MSAPYPAPKKFQRSRTNKVIGGVCAGVADYLNMDVTLVRVITVLLTLFTGVPIVAYIVALVLMPEADTPPAVPPPPPGYAPYPPAQDGHRDDVWGPAGPPWEQQPQPSAQPGPAPQPPANAAPPPPPATPTSPPSATTSTDDPSRA